jgi:phosphoglycerate dehydrogenase-like enzyme
MLILISDAFDETLPQKLQAFGEVTTDKERLSEAEVVLVRSKTKCTKEYIDNAPQLKLIIRGGVGIDNIDSSYAASKGIIVRNTPKSSSIAVAELTFALMLSAASNLTIYHNGMVEGSWLKSTKRNELYGKTLALLGCGNIATQVAQRAKAFGMKVVAYDKYLCSSSDAQLVSSAQDAIRDAHYISLHLPLTDETRGLVNRELLSVCTNSPVIVNTGRALCVNADDIVVMLEEGSIGWYATDVYPNDPPSSDYPILSAQRVTLTPHVGANSNENLARIGEETFDILTELRKGGLI